MDYDYGIIGGGPAGYTAGMMLAKKGFKVVLFEKDLIGGACLNRGCIPTKAMLHISQIYKEIKTSDRYGIQTELKDFDFLVASQKRDEIVEKIRKSLETAVKNSGVEIIYKNAEIKDQNTIISENIEYKVGKIVYAAGAKPRELKEYKTDGKFILSSDDVLKLKTLPKKVLIVGSGAIGTEWARIFANFGVETHLVEYAEHLIPAADIDVSKRVERIFRQNGVKFYLKDFVKKIENKTVFLNSGTVLEPDFVLCAVGREPVVPKDAENICILGDSEGKIQLAHYAIHHAKNFAMGIECNDNLIPFVIYGEPEIAWVGVNEQNCGDGCKSVSLPITALGKSWCDDCTDGFIKIITKNDLIVGAHVVSKEASALVQELLIAIQNNLTVSELKKVCFAHPTYSEGIFELLLRT